MKKGILLSAFLIVCCLTSHGLGQDIARLDPPSIARGGATFTLTIYGNYFWPECPAIDNNNNCIPDPSRPNNPYLPLVTFGLPGSPNPPTVTVQTRQLVPSTDPNHPAFDFPRPAEILRVTIPANLIAQSGTAPSPGYQVKVQTGGDQTNPIYGASAILIVGWRIDTVAGTGTAGNLPNQDNIPATSQQLYYPSAAITDPMGNLYIADTFNNCVRQVDTSGKIHTLAGLCGGPDMQYDNGNGVAINARMWAPWGLAFERQTAQHPELNLWVVEVGNSIVRKVTIRNPLNTSTISLMPVAGTPQNCGTNVNTQLRSPRSIAFDNPADSTALQNIYINDNGNQRIVKVDRSGMNPVFSVFAGNCDPPQPPDGVCNAFCNPTYIDNVNRTAARFAFPADLTFSLDFQKLYIADLMNDRIRPIDMATGMTSTLVGNGNYGYVPSDSEIPATALTAVTLNAPVNLALSVAGDLFISDRHNLRVRQVFAAASPANTFLPGIKTFIGTGQAGWSPNGTLATSAQIFHAQGIFWDYSQDPILGNLYFVDNHNHQIRRLSR